MEWTAGLLIGSVIGVHIIDYYEARKLFFPLRGTYYVSRAAIAHVRLWDQINTQIQQTGEAARM